MDRLNDDSSQAPATGAEWAPYSSAPETTPPSMAQAIRSKDWARTPIGMVATWPAALHAAVRICLDSHFPMVVLWGPELVMVYNDAYSDILGDKHPAALGKPVRQAWHEIWPTIGPLLFGVQATGTATRHDDLLLNLQRRGFTEECYFTFSYSPIRDHGDAVGGIFTTVLETTARVVSERRLRVLGELGSRLPPARDAATALDVVRNVLSSEPRSFLFTALYLMEPSAPMATLALSTGVEVPAPQPAKRLPLPSGTPAADAHPVVLALATGEPGVHPVARVLPGDVHCGVWPEPPSVAATLPLLLPGQHKPCGVFVAGPNPRRPFDKEYQAFFRLVVGHIATALANVRANEAEQHRADALAAIDRAKSQFFSDVSHELRTPLTLIVGPLETLLGEDLPQSMREQLDMVRRNACRLKSLVDSILDLSRIEAGRVEVQAVPTDVTALTHEVAGLFRGSIEAAGLRFCVRTDVSLQSVPLDAEIFEKVLLNLLSNALRYTATGEIEVRLERQGNKLCLCVRDTGCGIVAEDLPHVFDRFFRGRSGRARSVEGTGIGLALVQELVRLHGGSVGVSSDVGRGSTFNVEIPLGESELHSEPPCPQSTRPSSRAKRALDDILVRPFALPVAGQRFGEQGPQAEGPIKVLVADDDADLVRYIERVLADGCKIVAVRDGADALEAARRDRPDLILADVMMPGLDGYALLRAIRADERTRAISVILLSARAGEEPRLQALGAGADDYFVKPFSTRELIARVHSQVRLVRLRRAAIRREGELLQHISAVEHDLEGVLEATHDAFASLDRDLRVVAVNEAAARLLGASRKALVGCLARDVCPHLSHSELAHAVQRTLQTGTHSAVEHFSESSQRWFNVRCYPTRGGLIVFGADVTEQRRAQEALREAHGGLERRVAERTQELAQAHALLEAIFDRAPGGIAITDIRGRFLRTNAAYQHLVGRTEACLRELSVEDLTVPEDTARMHHMMNKLLRSEVASFAVDVRYARGDGTTVWASNFVSTIEEAGRPRYLVKIAQDISERKRFEQEILSSREELRALYDRLQSVREEERLMLAREVHDQLGQVLSAAKIDIKLLKDDISARASPPPKRRLLAELRSAARTLDEGIASVRRIAVELRPPELDGEGLAAAIRWHAQDFERRTRLQCAVHVSVDFLDPHGSAAMTLFRIYQEAMTNVLRHADASGIRIVLLRRGGHAVLRVHDDGVGIARSALRSGRSIGILGMRERAAVTRGRVLVGRALPRGTLVSARIPFESPADLSVLEHHEPQTRRQG